MNKPERPASLPPALTLREIGQRLLGTQPNKPPQPDPGMPAQEILLRLVCTGFSIPELAQKMRRAPWFVMAVIQRDRDSHAVRKTIAMLLAYQGLSFTQIWGAEKPPDQGPGPSPSLSE